MLRTPAIAALVCFAIAAGEARQEGVAALFLRYAQGDLVNAAEELKRYPASVLLNLAPDAARAWARTAGDGARAARVVAAFSLEAAHASLYTGGLAPQASGLKLDGPSYVEGLLRWGHGEIGKTPPDFRRRWLRAAVALAEQAQLADLVERYASLALAADPTDARATLARAVAVEIRTSPYGRDPRSISDRLLRDAEERFQAAMQIADVRGEARLRFGFLQIRAGNTAPGLALVSQAADDLDAPELRYLAHLFRGRALLALGRADDAAAAFEQSLAIAPGAQTARLALAALHLENGRADVASAMTDAALTARPGIDPWRSYWIGDGRLWHDLIDALRVML